MITPERMDRWSDWLGARVPGCAHLPARHPLKVSLVMGLLGLIAGWLTMTLWQVLKLSVSYDAVITGLMVGAMLGLFVWMPLLGWQQRPVLSVYWAMFFSMWAGVFDEFLSNNFGSAPQTLSSTAVLGLVVGLAYLAAGFFSNERRAGPLTLLVPLISGLLHGSIFAVAEVLGRYQALQGGNIHLMWSSILTANLSGWLFASIGITFGAAVWDRTPPPKFRTENGERTPEQAP